MKPFADFTFFGLLLYVAIPAIILGLLGRCNARWALISTVAFIGLQFHEYLEVRPGVFVNENWIVLGYAAWQWLLAAGFLRLKFKGAFTTTLILAILPLAVAKYLPQIVPHTTFGFFGISYVTFRALDVIFSIRDRVVTAVPPLTYSAFLFFFPTVSSGPIDRFRRFSQDWQRQRSRDEFLNDLDAAVQRLFRGFLYKFIIAALIEKHLMDRFSLGGGWHLVGYMYAYTFYLFFDFAGYSAFAISVSYLLGIHTPENFNKPFLSPNIRDFWNRWHISLSFWFRDHIYMRFLLAAAKGKWFKNKHMANYLGLYLTFGIMGLWHGTDWYYILYGLYHATLLSGYDWFARWNKTHHWMNFRGSSVVNILLTFHVIAFGLLLFSGRLATKPLPDHEYVVDKLTCQEITGYVWNRKNLKGGALVDIAMDGHNLGRVTANEFRQDLLDRDMGTGHYGFRFILPPSARDGREHWVVPVIVGPPPVQMTGPDIATPYTVKCPNPENPAPRSPKPSAPATVSPTPATPALSTPVPPTTPTPSATSAPLPQKN